MKLKEYGKCYRFLMGLLVLVSIFCMNHLVYAASGDELENGSNVTKTVKKENDKVKIGVRCGIDGFATYDYPTLVSITVSYDENFTGSIRMTPLMDGGQKKVAYEEDISLTKGEAKTFSFTPSTIGGTGKFKVELVDDKDKVIYRETDRVSLNSIGSNAILGVLSDDYSGLNYFDGVPVTLGSYTGTVSTLELKAESFPENSDSLAVLNYLLIANYDTAKLSQSQYDALKDWVNSGGVLVLSLGSNYQSVLHLFKDDFITGTLGSLKKQDLTWVKEELAQETLPDVDTISFEFDGGKEMNTFAADKTVYKKEVGMGAVVVLGYDLEMEPFSTYENKEAVATAFLQESAVSATSNRLNGMYSNMDGLYNGTNLAKTSNGSKRPSALLFGLVLVIYAIFVGPILYIILKKINKREKIWIAIPIVSILFTGIIFLVGLSYRVGKPIVDTFSVVTLEEDSKSEKIYVNLTCPQAKKYEVELNDKYSNLSYTSDYYNYSILDVATNEKDYDFMIKKTNKGISVVTDNDKAFEETSFSLNGTTDNNIGKVSTDLHIYTDGFEGTIINDTGYDLTNVVIGFEKHFYQAGDMKKGDTVKIDKTKLIPVYTYGTFEQLYSNNPKLYSDAKLYRNYNVDTFMESNYVDKNAYNQVYIWGQILAYKPEVVLDDTTKQYGNAVIYSEFTADYEDVSDIYCPDIKQLATSVNGDYDTVEGMLYGNDVIVTYDLSEYKGFTTLENGSYGEKASSYGYGEFAKVYAYNNESDAYDEILVDGKSLTGSDLQKYIIDNTITLKYEMTSSQDGTYMPRIIVRGDN